MRTAFRKSFLRDLRKLSAPGVTARVRSVIEGVESAPSLADVPGITSMSGADGFYRVRIGDYRIGVSVSGDEVEFVRVLHRRDIYRYFP